MYKLDSAFETILSDSKSTLAGEVSGARGQQLQLARLAYR